MEPGPVPMRAAALPTGHQMSVQTVRLGWHWQPYQYIRTASDVNGAQVARLPQWLAELGHEALTDAGWEPSAIACYRRDTALVNYYADGADLAGTRIKTRNQPVVSLSSGDTGRFSLRQHPRPGKPYTEIDLVSGDAFVFGGLPFRLPRRACHLPGPATDFPVGESTSPCASPASLDRRSRTVPSTSLSPSSICSQSRSQTWLALLRPAG